MQKNLSTGYFVHGPLFWVLDFPNSDPSVSFQCIRTIDCIYKDQNQFSETDKAWYVSVRQYFRQPLKAARRGGRVSVETGELELFMENSRSFHEVYKENTRDPAISEATEHWLRTDYKQL